MHRLIVFALFAILARATHAEVTIQLVPSADASKGCVCVEGLSPESLQALRQLPVELLSRHFKVFVQTPSEVRSMPSVLGEYTIEGEHLIFRPRYGLTNSQKYHAEFYSPFSDRVTIHADFQVPAAALAEPTKVDAIYPSTSELPQNVLRFYLHFSAPMQQGNVYRHIEISQMNGERLAFPFLELSEELWDRSGTRLTLLLDPGRVKQGLVPREEDGAIFEIGRKYRLTVRANWLDAQGSPLGTETTKDFTVTKEDFSQPNPLDWKIVVPSKPRPAKAVKSGTANSSVQSHSLQVVFPDSLDHALLGHCLNVVDSSGKSVSGRIVISDEERCWIFSPDAPWRAGEYSIHIDPILEDVAGNSIARPFEVDLSKPVPDQSKHPFLRFTIP